MDATTLSTAVARTRADHSASYKALAALEDAVEDPAPGRETEWLRTVVAALDALIVALNTQLEHNRDPDSLLSRIAAEHPRLQWQINQLSNDLDELATAEQSLRDKIMANGVDDQADLSKVRRRITELDSEYRMHRASETDLIYEATTVDIGGSG